VKIRQKHDPVDLEHLRQTLETRGWQMIRERIEEALDTARAQLDTEGIEAEFYRAQGRVAAYRKVLEIPGILQREIREREAQAEKLLKRAERSEED
jgi:hypothetical protein